jgi:hypothetical protein
MIRRYRKPHIARVAGAWQVDCRGSVAPLVAISALRFAARLNGGAA